MTVPAYDNTVTRLFLEGRTFSAWQDRPVSTEQLQQLYHLASMGPTSANCCPARIVFVATAAEKARLLPALDEGNRAKTQAAPVTAVIGYDLEQDRRRGFALSDNGVVVIAKDHGAGQLLSREQTSAAAGE